MAREGHRRQRGLGAVGDGREQPDQQQQADEAAEQRRERALAAAALAAAAAAAAAVLEEAARALDDHAGREAVHDAEGEGDDQDPHHGAREELRPRRADGPLGLLHRGVGGGGGGAAALAALPRALPRGLARGLRGAAARVGGAREHADDAADQLDWHERAKEQRRQAEAVRLPQEGEDAEDVPQVVTEARHPRVRHLARVWHVAARQHRVGRLEPELERLVEREREHEALEQQQRVEQPLVRLHRDAQPHRLPAAAVAQRAQQRHRAVREQQQQRAQHRQVVERRRLEVPHDDGARLADRAPAQRAGRQPDAAQLGAPRGGRGEDLSGELLLPLRHRRLHRAQPVEERRRLGDQQRVHRDVGQHVVPRRVPGALGVAAALEALVVPRRVLDGGVVVAAAAQLAVE